MIKHYIKKSYIKTILGGKSVEQRNKRTLTISIIIIHDYQQRDVKLHNNEIINYSSFKSLFCNVYQLTLMLHC